MSIKNIKLGYYGILLFGLVSLFADIVYEGGRSIVPEFLRTLGASAVAVGLITGLGELLGYLLRLPSGVLANYSGRYWFFLLLGYVFIIFIPALAISNGWELAAILVLAERIGKAMRAPSRDTLISLVAEDLGVGRAFGIHEVLDQIGAIVGPLIVSVATALSMNNLRFSFQFLVIPALATMLMLYFTYIKLHRYVNVPSPKTLSLSFKGLEKRFWIYSLVAAFSVVGFLHYSLIAYRIGGHVEPWMISLLFAAAMGIDAITALILGFAYDRYKLKVFWLIIAVSALPAVLAIKTSVTMLTVAILVYGVGLGAQESIYRSVVADFSPPEVRATAYGAFNTLYGLSWLIGGLAMGFMYDLGVAGSWLVAAFSVACQIAAALTLFLLIRSLK